MKTYSISVDGRPITPDPELPEEFSTLILPGFKTGYAKLACGELLLQEANVQGITIFYNTYKISKDVLLDFHCPSDLLQMDIAVSQNLHYVVANIGDLYLAQGHFNMLSYTGMTGSWYLKHGREYRCCHLVYSGQTLGDITPLFPDLDKWLSSGSRQRMLFKENCALSAEMKEVIKKILNDFAGEVREYHLYVLAKEMLFLSQVTAAAGERQVNGVYNTPRAIEEAKRLLELNYTQRFSLKDLSRKVGINEYALKAEFRRLTGTSIFNYLIKIRMGHAQKLVTETNTPLKAVAAMVGYGNKQSFCNAFKKYFKIPPGQYRSEHTGS